MHFLLGILESFIGSIIAIGVYLHYDFEGWFQERRAKHGKKIEDKRRKR